ncbi:6742_t:CDS:2, partial [Racocetra persica]
PNKLNEYPRIDISTSDFKDFRLRSDILVDKSLLIKEIIKATTILLITRPRQTDAWGKPLSQNESINRTLFVGGEIDSDLEGPKDLYALKISSDQKLMEKQGKYPVIFFSLKNTKGNNYQEIENNVIKKVQSAYKSHAYLVNSDQLDSFDKQVFQNHYRGEINKSDLQDSLRLLSELLVKHFHKKVFLLVDEYDETINHAYTKFGYESEEFTQVLDLVKEILSSVLKDSTYLEKSVLTGILKIAKSNLFS